MRSIYAIILSLFLFQLSYGADDWNARDAAADMDYDMLSNLQEFNAGTDPENPDSDYDSKFDGDDLWPEPTGNRRLHLARTVHRQLQH